MIIAKVEDIYENTLYSTCPNEHEAEFEKSIKDKNYKIIEQTKIYGLADEFFNYHFPANSKNYNLITIEEIYGQKNKPLDIIMSSSQIDMLMPFMQGSKLKVTQIIPVSDEIYKYIKNLESEIKTTGDSYNKSRLNELKEMNRKIEDGEMTFEKARDMLKNQIKEVILQLKNDEKIPKDTLMKMFSNLSESVKDDLKNRNINIPDSIRDKLLKEIEDILAE